MSLRNVTLRGVFFGSTLSGLNIRVRVFGINAFGDTIRPCVVARVDSTGHLRVAQLTRKV